MNFKYPLQKICTIPMELVQETDKLISDFERLKEYNFKLEDWLRLDSYFNPNNISLENVIGSKILNYLLEYFPDDKLFGWSISHLPEQGSVVDHCDRMLFHRFAKRIIVVTSDTPDVLNWHYSNDRATKIPYVLERGNAYRLNTAFTHGLKNFSNQQRRGFYLDLMPNRLFEKFNSHPDILKVIVSNSTGEKYVFYRNY